MLGNGKGVEVIGFDHHDMGANLPIYRPAGTREFLNGFGSGADRSGVAGPRPIPLLVGLVRVALGHFGIHHFNPTLDGFLNISLRLRQRFPLAQTPRKRRTSAT